MKLFLWSPGRCSWDWSSDPPIMARYRASVLLKIKKLLNISVPCKMRCSFPKMRWESGIEHIHIIWVSRYIIVVWLAKRNRKRIGTRQKFKNQIGQIGHYKWRRRLKRKVATFLRYLENYSCCHWGDHPGLYWYPTDFLYGKIRKSVSMFFAVNRCKNSWPVSKWRRGLVQCFIVSFYFFWRRKFAWSRFYH